MCHVCHGPVDGSYARCWVCQQHVLGSDSVLADVVVPIAYGIKGEQFYHDLRAYKWPQPSAASRARLRDLTLLFLREHWRCLTARAGGSFTHLAVVPTTRGRPGPHPLIGLIMPALKLPLIAARARPGYAATDRAFHADRFDMPADVSAADVLLLDDTWTTGSRIQSFAHGLKAAGAASVVAVVLGRHLKREYEPTRPLLDQLAQARFDIERCALPICTVQRE